MNIITNDNKNVTVEQLRAISVIMVVLFHMGYFELGFVGVDIFFLISGCLMYHQYQKYIKIPNGALAFLSKRIRRIGPELLLMLATVNVINLFLSSTFFSISNLFLESVLSLLGVFNVFLSHNTDYFGERELSIIYHTWSLSVELQYYILIGIFLVPNMPLRLVLVTVYFLFQMYFNFSQEFIYAYYKFLPRLLEFALGMIIGRLGIFNPYKNGITGRLGAIFKNIGTLSYSIYIWHVPVIYYANLLQVDGATRTVIIVVVISVFSYFSHYLHHCYIQNTSSLKLNIQPLRYGLYILAFSVVGSIGRVYYIEKKIATNNIALVSPYRQTCHSSADRPIEPKKHCVLGDGKRHIAVIGDSHGVELAYVLSKSARVHQFTYSGCRPGMDINQYQKECNRFLDEAIKIASQNETETVYISFRSPASIFGDHINVYPDFPTSDSDISNFDKFMAKMNIYKEVLRNSGVEIVYLLPIPELPTSIKKLRIDRQGQVTGVSRAWWDKRAGAVSSTLLEMGFEIYIDPTKSLCKDVTCYGAEDWRLFYFDDNHLSVEGIRHVLGLEVN